ncbi:MAG: ABC transporter permease [Candidatus Aminicenantes bacterium]|nr:ABC transporter permease [Candidatus Aminicenantes bacterium]MBL7082132.1 ABC transporter permease [Candidatus Aminicenantes bacterium]
MLKNYVKIALRNIKRHKAYSAINILGLTIGMSCCLFITLWIFDELSTDKFHKDSDQIYQTIANGEYSSSPLPLAPALKEEFPEVLHASRYEGFGNPLLRRGERAFYEEGIKVVDSDFFKIFSFSFINGNPDTALAEVFSIVISEEIAQKYFPDENPIGQVLTMNDQADFTVTGVIENLPQNSTLQFNIAISYEVRILAAQNRGQDPYSWGWWSPNTFLKLQKNLSIDTFNQKITSFFLRKIDGRGDETLSMLPFTGRKFFLTNTKSYIIIFSAVAVFILLVACINFINLSTARSATRAGEIGIRKVVGANRKSLIIQFLGESFIMALIALISAWLLVSLLLPFFNTVTGKQLAENALIQPPILLIFIGLLLLTSIAAGSYPALVLSSFRPVQGLKKHLKIGPSGSLFRKILVIFQFSISIILIIGSGIVFKQLHYIKTRDLGYAKEQLLTISLKGESKKSYELLKNRLQPDERILGVTGLADDLPFFGWTTSSISWEGKDPKKDIHVGFNLVDYDIIETLGIEMTEGRGFIKEFTADTETGYLVNEELAKLMGFESVVGRPFTKSNKPGKIVGVMKNVHFLPLTTLINPIFFQLDPSWVNHMVIRIQTENLPSKLRFIENTWKEIIPLYPFEYEFVDESFNNTYFSITRMSSLTNIFTAIAIFIACLGLFGLASFSAEQRSKEIGVRKVLGASVSGIFLMLSKQFTKWVLLANFIAWPIAYYLMDRWLNNFAYRIHINIVTFLLSATVILVIALLTVSYQSIKASLANPVDSLRYE